MPAHRQTIHLGIATHYFHIPDSVQEVKLGKYLNISYVQCNKNNKYGEIGTRREIND